MRSKVSVDMGDMTHLMIVLSSSDDEGVTPLSSQGDHWPGLAADHLAQLCLESKERTRLREGVESRKNCVAHRTVITARDTVLQVSHTG